MRSGRRHSDADKGAGATDIGLSNTTDPVSNASSALSSSDTSQGQSTARGRRAAFTGLATQPYSATEVDGWQHKLSRVSQNRAAVQRPRRAVRVRADSPHWSQFKTADPKREVEACLTLYRLRKGRSGNPGGRPRALGSLQLAARQHADMALRVLAEIAEKGKREASRIAAATALLDRGFGRPMQSVDVRVLMEPSSSAWSNDPLPELRAPKEDQEDWQQNKGRGKFPDDYEQLHLPPPNAPVRRTYHTVRRGDNKGGDHDIAGTSQGANHRSLLYTRAVRRTEAHPRNRNHA
jgi:hypothetical protein